MKKKLNYTMQALHHASYMIILFLSFTSRGANSIPLQRVYRLAQWHNETINTIYYIKYSVL